MIVATPAPRIESTFPSTDEGNPADTEIVVSLTVVYLDTDLV